MWSNLELEGGSAGPTTAPRIFVLNEAITPELLERTVPPVANVNINQSSGVHFGPQFVTITQIVENREPITPSSGDNQVNKANRRNRLPLDKNIVTKRKHWIRFCWAAVVLAVLLTVALIVHLVIIAKNSESLLVEEVPWRVTREMWLARHSPDNLTLDEYSPIKLVIIHHTVSPECFDFNTCAEEMRTLQDYFLSWGELSYDLPFNFVVGNDGRVYDSRRWNRQGMHTRNYNRCSIGIAFMGDYRETHADHSRVTDLQMSRLRLLLQEGVDQGYLRPDYSVVGALDLLPTLSPGENLYRAIRSLEHFDRSDFRNLTCDDIINM